MPGFRFDRPVGAGADVKELRYIISLQQTSSTTRENSTVSSLDILALLKSRYGLTISHEDAINAVRSLGGGDTFPQEEETESVEPSSPLAKQPSTIIETPDKDDGASLPESTRNRSSMISQLHKLRSSQQTSVVDHHSMLSLQDGITADLAAQVVEKTKSHRNLSEDVTEDVERPADSEVRNPNGDGNSGSIKKSGQAKGEQRSSNRVSFAEMESGEGPLPEFLDLVQVLSTLLTPKFAKLAHDAANEPVEDLAQEESRSDAEEQRTTNSDEIDLGAKLANRLKDYGHRKLNIKDDEKIPYSAGEMLDIAKNALLKFLPDTAAPVVDETLIKLLLISHGEVERADDEQLIQEMVDAASTPSGVLDRMTLIQAISSDLGLWDPHCQDTNTSFFYDVFGAPLPSVKTKLKAETENEEQPNSLKKHVDEEQEPPKISMSGKIVKFFFPIIYDHVASEKYEFSTAFLGVDTVLDTASSSLVCVLMWVWFILIGFVYGTLVLLTPRSADCSSGDYWCICKNTVVSWSITASLLIAMGFYLILPLSVGNNPADQSPRRNFFASVASLINTVIPFCFVTIWADRNIDKIDNEGIKWNIERKTTEVFAIVVLVIGCFFALVFFIKGLVMACVDHNHPHKLHPLAQMIVSGSSWSGEARVYNAAKIKIDKLLFNAVRLHDSEQFHKASRNKVSLSNEMALTSARDQASRNFILHGETKEKVGGLVWTLWRLADGSLYDHEGIWINERLIIIQATQLIFAVVITIGLLIATLKMADEAEAYRESIKSDNLPDWIMEIFPTGAMVKSSFIPATFVAMAMLVFITLVYLPSSVSTVLKFRGQVISSLDSSFQKYRVSVDSTYMNTANAIWGMIASGILFYIFIGLLVFLFAWPVTRELAFTITAWGVGLGITIGIKMVITNACRKMQYRNFYRIKPAAARLSALALECWHIGLAGSILIGRISQFLGAALFWVGRIDVPFLSEDVVLLGYGFDVIPHHFFKDLLAHEAHRHPYIEQLSQMYLMKLRHGDRFISNVGAVWRQLVILALFPWLAKHRVFSEERRVMAVFEAEEGEEREMREADALVGVKDMTNNVVGVGTGVGGEVVDAGGEIFGVGADIASAVGKVATKGGTAVAEGGVGVAKGRVGIITPVMAQKHKSTEPSEENDELVDL